MAVATGAVAATAVTFAIVQHRGAPAARTYRLLGQWQTLSGPSSKAYHHLTTLQAGSEVRPICAVYGESYQGNPLWYWTHDGWINDQLIQTGQETSKTGQCTGNVESPTEGDGTPRKDLGPFALIGGTGIPEHRSPSRASQQVGTLAKDSLVTIDCWQTGNIVVVGGDSGGTSGSDWDRLPTGGWIPNADLLTGNGADSPAPSCPTPSPSSS